MNTIKEIEREIVFISLTSCKRDLQSPWAKHSFSEHFGSGFCVKLRSSKQLYIVTNYHVIEGAVSIIVRTAHARNWKSANVVAISPEMDLALLSVEDVQFWRDAKCAGLTFSEGDIKRGRKLMVLGFPQGGDSICHTKGISSRICEWEPIDDDSPIVVHQTDAAINDGNSGGPIIAKDRKTKQWLVCGIACASDEDMENVGYFIPSSSVKNFIAQVTHNVSSRIALSSSHKEDARPILIRTATLPIRYQMLKNDTQRESLGLAASCNGLRVSSQTQGINGLRTDDVIVSINDVSFDSEGNVALDQNERVSWQSWLASSMKVGDVVDLKIWRDGHFTHLVTKLVTDQRLMGFDEASLFDETSYISFGGCLFTVATMKWIQSRSWPGKKPKWANDGALLKQHESQQQVIMARILRHELNLGYDACTSCVSHCDGVKINRLKDLENQIHIAVATGQRYLRLDLNSLDTVVLDVSMCMKHHEEIHRLYGLPEDMEPGKIRPFGN